MLQRLQRTRFRRAPPRIVPAGPIESLGIPLELRPTVVRPPSPPHAESERVLRPQADTLPCVVAAPTLVPFRRHVTMITLLRRLRPPGVPPQSRGKHRDAIPILIRRLPLCALPCTPRHRRRSPSLWRRLRPRSSPPRPARAAGQNPAKAALDPLPRPPQVANEPSSKKSSWLRESLRNQALTTSCDARRSTTTGPASMPSFHHWCLSRSRILCSNPRSVALTKGRSLFFFTKAFEGVALSTRESSSPTCRSGILEASPTTRSRGRPTTCHPAWGTREGSPVV